MDTKKYIVFIKNEIKTSDILICDYNENTNKWDITFNNYAKYNIDWDINYRKI